MKQLLLTTIVAVVLVGCATIQSPEAFSAKASAISIRQAAWDGDIKVVKQHLAAGVDVDEKDLYGETSLHYAADKGHKEIVELLIANGADVNAKLIYGTTPLDSTNNKKIRDLLRKYGGKTGEELEADGK
tara:strand:- start:58 stop:447 length:390 start_codon:yes stop_codon:yes gene_type:complete